MVNVARRLEEVVFKVRELFSHSDDKGRKMIKYGSPSVERRRFEYFAVKFRNVSCTSDSIFSPETIFHLFFFSLVLRFLLKYFAEFNYFHDF